MTYPWAIVLSSLGVSIAIAAGVSSMKLVPDPITPEIACIQQRGTWTLHWHNEHWYSSWHYTCEFKEAKP